MFRRSGWLWAAVLLLTVAAGCASNSGNQRVAEMAQVVEVKVGDSPANVSTALNHTVSIAALESGIQDFEVDGPGGTHRFRLTESQVADLLGGSTVMTTTSGSEMNVSLRMLTKAPEASGSQPQSTGW